MNPNELEKRVILHTDFPEVIDNTARTSFTCPQQFRRQVIQKLAPKGRATDLHFGGAFALGLETLRRAFYEQGKSQIEAFSEAVHAATLYFGDFEPPAKHVKTYDRLIFALFDYLTSYPLATDIIQPIEMSPGRRAIEFTFAIPIPGTKHPQTGNPILYAGRFDMIGAYQGARWGLDDKTTSQLGARWNKSWNLASQLTGYAWAAAESGLPLVGMIMRGQSILTHGSEFAQAIEYRPKWQIERWLKQLQKDVARIIQAWEQDDYDYNLGPMCTLYSGCPFKQLCLSNNPQIWIETEYENHYWNPLNKNPEEEA